MKFKCTYLHIGDRVICKEFYHKEFIGQTGTIMLVRDMSVLVKFDTKFSTYLHNDVDERNADLYYYVRPYNLEIFNVEEFKYENLDKENWWED